MPIDPTRYIRLFVLFSLVYLICAFTLSLSLHGATGLAGLASLVPHLLGCVVVALVGSRLPRFICGTLVAFTAIPIFFWSFSKIKTTMPLIMDYWADGLLAKLDRALHLGSDAWIYAHYMTDWLPIRAVEVLYLDGWGCLICGVQFVALALDSNQKRAAAYLCIYVLSWVAVGNVLALVFLSVGPVYSDALLNEDSFADLNIALQESGIAQSVVGRLQDWLWQLHSLGETQFGSGISAFPSVHVSVATVAAFYMHDMARHAVVSVIAVLIVLTILLLSVMIGWHYAVDGYASILIVAGLRYLLIVRRGLASKPWRRLVARSSQSTHSVMIDPTRSGG